MFTVGTLIKVKTRTVKDTFGEVVWKIVEVGLPAPEPNRKGMMDGIMCVMLGGTGPSARSGYTVMDSEATVQRNMAEGITTIVPPEKQESTEAFYNNTPKQSAGGIEM